MPERRERCWARLVMIDRQVEAMPPTQAIHYAAERPAGESDEAPTWVRGESLYRRVTVPRTRACSGRLVGEATSSPSWGENRPHGWRTTSDFLRRFH